jgi:hypothetical protein
LLEGAVSLLGQKVKDMTEEKEVGIKPEKIGEGGKGAEEKRTC